MEEEAEGGRGAGRERMGDLREKIPLPAPLVADEVAGWPAEDACEEDAGARGLSEAAPGARIFCSISSNRWLIWLNCACSFASASGSLSSGSAYSGLRECFAGSGSCEGEEASGCDGILRCTRASR